MIRGSSPSSPITTTLRNPAKLTKDADHLLDDEASRPDQPPPEEEQNPPHRGQGRGERHQGLWTEVQARNRYTEGIRTRDQDCANLRIDSGGRKLVLLALPGADSRPWLLQLDQAVSQQLNAVTQHVLADLLDRCVELAAQRSDRGSQALGLSQDLEEPATRLVHTVVMAGLDIEQNGLRRQGPVHDSMRYHGPARLDGIPFQCGIQNRLP